MKKVLAFFTILILTMTLIGCSESTKNNDEQNNQDNATTVQNQNTNEDNEQKEAETDNDANVEIPAVNQQVENMQAIPEGFPIDMIPIYGGSQITNGYMMEQEDLDIYMVSGNSLVTKEILADFYRDTLKDATEKKDLISSTGEIHLQGVIDNKTIYISLNDEKFLDKFESTFRIQVDVK